MKPTPSSAPEIYFDHAATCGARPDAVAEAMLTAMHESANPGRSGHRRSIAAAERVFDARESVARLFGIADERRLVFAQNATDALNLAIRGLLDDTAPPRTVITTRLEHNSVMRPLRALEDAGAIRVEHAPDDAHGFVDADALATRLADDDVTAVIVNHASNVTGLIQPVAAIGAVCRARGVVFVVDAAQSAGALDLDVDHAAIDLLAFTGHKGLLGPQGTGGLFVRDGIEISPLRRGGSGSRSEEERHPDFYPDRLEAGTPNTPGLAGLDAAVRFVESVGPGEMLRHERALAARFSAGLDTIDRARGSNPPHRRVAVVSVEMDGVPSSRVAMRLDRDAGILVRAGLHCAPAAHRALGTHPAGTARFSFGWFNTEAEVDRAIDALARIAATEPASSTPISG